MSPLESRSNSECQYFHRSAKNSTERQEKTHRFSAHLDSERRRNGDNDASSAKYGTQRADARLGGDGRARQLGIALSKSSQICFTSAQPEGVPDEKGIITEETTWTEEEMDREGRVYEVKMKVRFVVLCNSFQVIVCRQRLSTAS